MWLSLFADTWRVNYHPWEAYAALGLIVWTIRIAGKLLSGAMIGEQDTLFAKHRKFFKIAAMSSGALGGVLTVLNFPLSVYSYLVLGGILVLAYFALALFSSQGENEVAYAKHAAGGIAFAFGTALVANIYLPNLGMQQMLLSREFICFAVLCLLASSATELWAHAAKAEDREVRAADEIALSLPLTLLGAAALVFAVQDNSMSTRPFFYGILTGAALLQVLNRTRAKFSMGTVKVLTSLCLLFPGVIFLAYAWSR